MLRIKCVWGMPAKPAFACGGSCDAFEHIQLHDAVRGGDSTCGGSNMHAHLTGMPHWSLPHSRRWRDVRNVPRG